jgi:hypothetical protein
MEAHEDNAEEVGAKVDRADPAIPQQTMVAGSGGRL